MFKLKKSLEDYSFEKFNIEIKEIGKPKELTLGDKKVEIFEKGMYEIIKGNPDKIKLKKIWATGKVLDANSSGRFFRDFLSNRKGKDGLGVLYKVYGIGDDMYDYGYFTGPQKESATKRKYFQGVPVDKLSQNENTISKPIVNY